MNHESYNFLRYDKNDLNKPCYEDYLDQIFLDKVSSLDKVGHCLIQRAIEHEEQRMKNKEEK